jgi:hypothetical protein
MLVLLAATGIAAQQIETQHGFDATVPFTPKLDVLFHCRLRTQPGRLGLYQVRLGPIVSYDLTDRWTLLGGYYFAQQENRDGDFIAGHRAFGGVEGALLRRGRAVVDGRALVERFVPDNAPNFNRYRARTRFSWKAAVSPYVGQEWFYDRKGWRSVRVSGGVRWNVARKVELDLGYFYEPRRASVGPARHMFLTSIHFKRALKRSGDPDL